MTAFGSVSIIGNYPLGRQFSMFEYARLLQTACADEFDIEANLWQPGTAFGRLLPARAGSIARYLDTVLFALPTLPHSDVAIVADQSNAFYVPRLHAPLVVVICHDLIPQLRHMGRLSGWEISRRAQLRIRLQNAGLAKADHVICVSEATRQDLIDLTQVDPARCTTVHNCMTRRIRPLDAATLRAERERLGLAEGRRWVLAFGKSPYKNAPLAVRAFAQALPRLGGDTGLIVVGDWNDDAADEAARLGIADRVRIFSGLSDEVLAAVYQTAEALLFTSKYEGFGWPILEAQTFGLPVICTDVASIPEVAGDAALLCPPDDDTALADALTRALTDDAIRQDLARKGAANLQRFTYAQWHRQIGDTIRQAWAWKFG